LTVAALHKKLKYSELHDAEFLILNLAIHSEPPGFFLDVNSIPRAKNACGMNGIMSILWNFRPHEFHRIHYRLKITS